MIAFRSGIIPWAFSSADYLRAAVRLASAVMSLLRDIQSENDLAHLSAHDFMGFNFSNSLRPIGVKA